MDRANPSRFISELFERGKSTLSCSATVCDVSGNMFLADLDDLVVAEIDGVKPAEILPPVNRESDLRTADGFDDFEESDFSDFEPEAESEPKSMTQTKDPDPRTTENLDAPSPDASEDEDWIQLTEILS